MENLPLQRAPYRITTHRIFGHPETHVFARTHVFETGESLHVYTPFLKTYDSYFENGKLPKSDHSDPLKPKSDHFETWSNLIGPPNLAQYDWLLYRVTSFWASWPNMIGSYIERRHFGPDWAQRFVLLGPGNLGQLTSRVNGTSGFLHVKYLDQFFEVTLNIWPNIKNGRNERLFATF